MYWVAYALDARVEAESAPPRAQLNQVAHRRRHSLQATPESAARLVAHRRLHIESKKN